MKEIGGNLVATGMTFGIAVSRFNDFLTKQLKEGAVDCVVRHGGGADSVTIAWVPGANELPQVADRMAAGGSYAAVIVLGAVVQGATPHAELINAQVSRSLAQTASRHGVPVINGVVCANTLEQAIERCGTKAGNKGFDAAMSAIEMVNLMEQL